MIRSRAPVRIDFAGGWTDVALFAASEVGSVVNASIQIYSFAMLTRKHTVLGVDSKNIDKEILDQFPLAEKVTELLGLTLLPMDHYEADDAIASVCELFKNENLEIIIGSLDKDLMQCLDVKNISMYSTRYKSFTTGDDVYKKFGVHPQQIPDFLALVGDSSDGIPGMNGIGEKTASVLLEEYENIENIYQNLNIWKNNIRGGERHANTIYENYELLKLFKSLTTLRLDVKVPKKIEKYSLSKLSSDELKKFSAKYQLNINF